MSKLKLFIKIINMKISQIVLSLSLLMSSTIIFAQCSTNQHQPSHVTNVSWSHHRDIVDIAASNESLSTLVTAVQAADLVSTLKADGPYTVFAPVNSAFAKLPDGVLNSLLEPGNKKKLSEILTYHVVAGKFKAAEVLNAIQASPKGSFAIKTVSGQTLKAMLRSGTVVLEDQNGNFAAVTKPDVNASNGVIHIIDSVVLPK